MNHTYYHSDAEIVAFANMLVESGVDDCMEFIARAPAGAVFSVKYSQSGRDKANKNALNMLRAITRSHEYGGDSFITGEILSRVFDQAIEEGIVVSSVKTNNHTLVQITCAP